MMGNRSRSRTNSRLRTNSTTLSLGVFRFEQDERGTPEVVERDDEDHLGPEKFEPLYGRSASDLEDRAEDLDLDVDYLGTDDVRRDLLDDVKGKGKAGYGSGSDCSHLTCTSVCSAVSNGDVDADGDGDRDVDGDVPSLIGSPESYTRSPDDQGRTMSRARGESVDMLLGTPGTPDWDRWMGFGFDGPEGGVSQVGGGAGGKGKGRAEGARVGGMDGGMSGESWDRQEVVVEEPEVRMMSALRLGPVLRGPISRQPTPDIPSRMTTPTPASICLPSTSGMTDQPTSSTAKKEFPQWLKNRPRSSSSASLASKFSLTSTASKGSLSSRLSGVRNKIKNKVGNKGEVQTDTTADAAVKKEPKGLMRRLMIRSKTTPVLAHSGPGTNTKVDDAHASGTIVSPRRSSMGLSDVFATASSERRVSASIGTREAETGETEREVVHEVDDDLDIVYEARDQELPVLRASLFQDKLPRELQVMVMQAVIDLHVGDHQRLVEQGRWKGDLARQRWYGETAGRRELLILRRVSSACLLDPCLCLRQLKCGIAIRSVSPGTT